MHRTLDNELIRAGLTSTGITLGIGAAVGVTVWSLMYHPVALLCVVLVWGAIAAITAGFFCALVNKPER